MSYFFSLLFAILCLPIIIFVHEFGHYWMMCRCGVKVTEFTIGFGSTLWEKQLANGTIFRLKPIVLGGYTMPVETGPNSMASTTAGQRALIYVAGMAFNVAFAFPIAVAANVITLSYPAILHPYVSWIHLSWLPGGAPVWHNVSAFLKCALSGLIETVALWLAMPAIIIYMFATKLSHLFSVVSGPVGAVVAVADYVNVQVTVVMKISAALQMLAALSVAIAGMNLLPFYPLDGGRLLDIPLVKWIKSEKVLNVIRKVATGLALAIIFAALASDLWHIACWTWSGLQPLIVVLIHSW